MTQNFPSPVSWQLFKWCNCFRPSYGAPIIADCYDYPLEAIEKFEDFDKWEKGSIIYETKLISVFRYMPEFLQAKVIKHHFNPTVKFEKLENTYISIRN